MAIFSDGLSRSDPDIAISVWLIACCLVSTSLNPIVFLYNYKRPNTVQRVVYRVLSVLDFTMCLLAPIMVVHNALKSTDCLGRSPQERVNQTNSHLLTCGRAAATLEKVYSGFTMPCVYLPTILTAVLTSARLYHIRYPLRDPLHKKILTILLVLCAVQTCINVLPLFDTSFINSPVLYPETGFGYRVAWWAPMQAAYNFDPYRIGGLVPMMISVLIILIAPILAQILGLVATILTMWQIKVQSRDLAAQQSQRDNVRVTKKILVTNTGSLMKTGLFLTFFAVVLSMAILTGKHTDSFLRVGAWINILHSTLGPCLISAVNPIIFITMTPNCLHSIRNIRVSITD